MTSISSTSSYSNVSPLDRLKQELSNEVAAGSVKSQDADTLTSALDDIDASLKSSSPARPSGSSPANLQSKISNLIDKQVSAGTLTSDQATELKQVFQNAAPKEVSHGAGRPGGGAGGPPPASQKASDDDSSTTSSSASSSSSAADLLANFLKQLQSSTSDASSYTANGKTASSSGVSLLFSIEA
jgi:hypothetical protein